MEIAPFEPSNDMNEMKKSTRRILILFAHPSVDYLCAAVIAVPISGDSDWDLCLATCSPVSLTYHTGRAGRKVRGQSRFAAWHKIIKEGFGMSGKDIRIGADMLIRAALSDEFKTASGRCFDNDVGQFAAPHPNTLNAQKTREVMQTIKATLAA